MKNLIFSTKFIFIFFLLGGSVFSGCQKENDDVVHSSESILPASRTNVIPSVVNGTLKFLTEDDAYQYLAMVAEELKNENNTILEDQVAMGFNSLLTLANNNNTDLYFLSPHLNAVLNSRYEIMIGNNIYTHKNHEETWIVNANDSVALEIFRSKVPGSFIEDKEILPGMIIEGRRTAETLMCCQRFGFWPRLGEAVSEEFNVQGTRYRLRGRVEVVRGSWWGIFVWGTCRGFKNGVNSNLPIEVDRVFGQFRNSSCALKHSASDDDFCNSCKKVSANVFHRSSSNSFFNTGEVGANFKLFYAPFMFVPLSVFPGCS